MFDNHIQNICIAQMRRAGENNKAIEEWNVGATQTEKKEAVAGRS